MEIAPIVHLIMDIVMDVGIMVMITRMDVNLVEIKAVDQCNNTERIISTREVP